MNKKVKTVVGWIIAILIFAIIIFLSWLSIVAIIKAITWCFGLAFNWKIATGIWLLLLLLKLSFQKGGNHE